MFKIKIKLITFFIFLLTNFNLYSQLTDWTTVNLNLGVPLMSVHFINESTGFVCGHQGNILRSTNGGVNWIPINSGTSLNLEEIVMISPTKIASSAYAPIIRYSSDGGNIWNTVLNGTGGTFKMTKFVRIDSNTVYIAYGIGNSLTTFYKTTNGGANWTGYNITNFGGCSMYFLDANTGYMSGAIEEPNNNYNAVYKTTNAGVNWIMKYSMVSNATVPGSIWFKNLNEGYWCQSIPITIKKTTDGGTSWNIVYTSNFYIYELFFTQNVGWAASSYFLNISSNGGSNWFSQESFVRFFDIQFINNQTGWMVDEYSKVWKTTNGGGIITGINNENITVPDKFSLSQNYPNPFNPSTKIKFSIPYSPFEGRRSGLTEGKGDVKLVIFDVLGQHIALLVNQQLSPGTYEVEWSANGGAADYPSGIYFYTLKTESFNQTKRMVLVK